MGLACLFSSYGLFQTLLSIIFYISLNKQLAQSVNVYPSSDFGQRTKPPPLARNESVCVQYCHKHCEKYRYEPIPGSSSPFTDMWSRVNTCNDANERCDCGPRPDDFHPSHCDTYCGNEHCDGFYNIAEDETGMCRRAKERCTCPPPPVKYDPDQWPSEDDCNRICHTKCKWSSDEYNFCVKAQPKCSCGIQPHLLWALGGFAVIFAVSGCFYFIRRANRGGQLLGGSGISGPSTQVTGGGFLAVIPPTPAPYAPVPSPAYNSPYAPAAVPLLPMSPPPSAPAEPAAGGWALYKAPDEPPAYSDPTKR